MDIEEFPMGTILIEIQGLYDAWSVAKLPDGTMINRWDKGTDRYKRVQEWIENLPELSSDDIQDDSDMM